MFIGFQDVKAERDYSGQTIFDRVRENQAIALSLPVKEMLGSGIEGTPVTLRKTSGMADNPKLLW